MSFQMLPEGFRLVNVQGGPPYPALFESLSQGFFIHQTPSCYVD